MFLFLDTETSDLLHGQQSLTDPVQPWAVGVAAELLDKDFVPLMHIRALIKAEGRKIRQDAYEVHGISSAMAERYGLSQVVVLGTLVHMMGKARFLIGHGIEYDRTVIEGQLQRMGKDTNKWMRPGVEMVCTMKEAAEYCRIEPNFEGGTFRWPSLDAAGEILLGAAAREGKHDAWVDMKRAQGVFRHLYDRGAFAALIEED